MFPRWLSLFFLLLAGVEGNGSHDADGNLLEGLDPHELAITASGELGDTPATIKFWADRTPEEKATMEAPYSPPAGWLYNTTSGPVEGKINVHLVPHSHDDVGCSTEIKF